MKRFDKQLVSYIFITLCVILVLMPLHGFFTTWAGSNTGGLLVWRAWKEILLMPATLGGLYLLITDKRLRDYLLRDRLNQMILIMTSWVSLIAIFASRDLDATLLGSTIYLRMFVAYLLARIVVFYKPVAWSLVLKLIFIPFSLVVGFGLLQMFVLPHDFLSYFGYEKGVTIPPFFTIDEQTSAIRISSLTRGPNSLGLYLLLPITLLFHYLLNALRSAKWRQGIGLVLAMLVSLVVLYGSHSRSAWIGLVVALAVYIFFRAPRLLRNIFLAVSCVALVLGVGFVYNYRDSRFVQDVILHDNPDTGGEASSNQERIRAWNRAVQDVRQDPLAGCGVGCAGPASFHHEDRARIAENQYLQAAQEMGVIGATLLLAVLVLVARRLWLLRSNPVALCYLAVLAGISIAGLLMHSWADDIVAYVWWISFGFLASGTVKYKHDKSASYKKTT